MEPAQSSERDLGSARDDERLEGPCDEHIMADTHQEVQHFESQHVGPQHVESQPVESQPVETQNDPQTVDAQNVDSQKIDSQNITSPNVNSRHVESQHDESQSVHLLAHKPIPDTPSHNSQRAFYTSAQWTADGTTIMTSSSDRAVSSIVLPADLLQHGHEDRLLESQSSTRLPEPTQVLAPAPYFSLAEPYSQTFLVGCRDHPLHLYHAFPGSSRDAALLASYRLANAMTEAFITPASLLWRGSGSHFLCGSASRLDYFDVSRPGADGPVLTIPTIPSRRHIAKGSGVGIKGTVAALAASPDGSDGLGGLVAAGTRSRWIGLYDLNRANKAVAFWAVAKDSQVDTDVDVSPDRHCGGQGIVQLAWSPCGRYLVVNERQSPHLLVYDVRGSGALLACLTGRHAPSQQRLTCDVYPSPTTDGAGFEVWAGSADGSVLVWDSVGAQSGSVCPSWEWRAHEAPVGSVKLHGCGLVVATCSGGWEHVSDGVAVDGFGGGGRGEVGMGGPVTMDESAVKIWSIGGSGKQHDDDGGGGGHDGSGHDIHVLQTV